MKQEHERCNETSGSAQRERDKQQKHQQRVRDMNRERNQVIGSRRSPEELVERGVDDLLVGAVRVGLNADAFGHTRRINLANIETRDVLIPDDELFVVEEERAAEHNRIGDEAENRLQGEDTQGAARNRIQCGFGCCRPRLLCFGHRGISVKVSRSFGFRPRPTERQ